MNIFKPVYYSFSCTGRTVMYCLIDTSMCQAWRWNVESPIKGTTWFPFFEGAQNLPSSTVCPAVFKIYDIQPWDPAENRSSTGFPEVLLLSYQMRTQLYLLKGN